MQVVSSVLAFEQPNDSIASIRERESNMVLWCGIAIAAVLVLWVVFRMAKRR